MPIIEFVGIARTGKTTIAKYLEETLPNLTYHPERHDLVPKEVWGDNFEHSYWYANYCVDTMKASLEEGGMYLFERGVVDQLIIAKVYFKMNWINENQYMQFEQLLNPEIKNVDKVFAFLIPIELSVSRAMKLGKDVTKAIPYMNMLYDEYKNLINWFPNCSYLPENSTIDELKIKVKGNIEIAEIA